MRAGQKVGVRAPSDCSAGRRCLPCTVRRCRGIRGCGASTLCAAHHAGEEFRASAPDECKRVRCANCDPQPHSKLPSERRRDAVGGAGVGAPHLAPHKRNGRGGFTRPLAHAPPRRRSSRSGSGRLRRYSKILQHHVVHNRQSLRSQHGDRDKDRTRQADQAGRPDVELDECCGSDGRHAQPITIQCAHRPMMGTPDVPLRACGYCMLRQPDRHTHHS